MGQVVTKIYRSAIREIKMYNIDRRVQKVISKEKPTRAPLHPAAVKELKSLKEANVPTDYLYKKNETLNEYLKNVFVTTPGSIPPRLESPVRSLPQNRQLRGGLSYGYSEAEEGKVPEGKVSLKQALQFITAHQVDPESHTTAAISQKYQMDPKVTGDILEHFKMFNISSKKKGVDPDSLSEEDKLAMRVQAMTMLNADEIVKELNLGSRFSKYKEKLHKSQVETSSETVETNKGNGSKDNR